MVKHGRNRKRKSGRTGRTKLKNGNFHKFRKPNITDPTVREHWDPRKSPSYNLAAMGLRGNINEDHVTTTGSSSSSSVGGGRPLNPGDQTPNVFGGRAVQRLEPLVIRNAQQVFGLPSNGSHVIPKQRRKMWAVSAEDQTYMIPLLTKYETNYGRMFRDLRLNPMQHTETRLRKLTEGFFSLRPNELRVDVPDNVTLLMKEHRTALVVVDSAK